MISLYLIYGLSIYYYKYRKFITEWETIYKPEATSTYQLSYKNVEIAIKELIKHFGIIFINF